MSLGIPPPLIFSFADRGELLVSRGSVYCPSTESTDSFILRGGKKTQMEAVATLQELERRYKTFYEPVLRRKRQEYIELMHGIERKGLNDLEQKLQEDAFKIWYVTEVQNRHLESFDAKNEIAQAEHNARDKRAYLDALRYAERSNEDIDNKVKLPKHALFAENKIYSLKRRFFSEKADAVIQGKRFVIAKEHGDVATLRDRSALNLEKTLLEEWGKESRELLEVIGNLERYKSAVVSGVAGRDGLEYNNLGFAYCQDTPVVYLRFDQDHPEAVAVYLKKDGDAIGYEKNAFMLSIKDNQHLRLHSICLKGWQFQRLNWKLRKEPIGQALIRFLHNARDRVGPIRRTKTNETVNDNESSSGEG